MVWFLVDDNLALHRKANQAGNAAIGLWTRCGAWSAGNLTDGYVPSNVARQLGNQNQIKNLLEAGLWSRVTGGYQFHDWADRQPTAELVRQRREGARKRKQSQRDREQNRGDVTASVTRDSHARARPSPLQGLGIKSLELDARARSGAAPPKGATPPRAAPEKNTANNNGFYESLEIQNCPLCDNEGYRPNKTVCDHIDRTQTAAKGSAAVREALNEAKAKRANQ